MSRLLFSPRPNQGVYPRPCTECELPTERVGFVKDRNSPEGHSLRCKECARRYADWYRRHHPGYQAAVERQRWKYPLKGRRGVTGSPRSDVCREKIRAKALGRKPAPLTPEQRELIGLKVSRGWARRKGEAFSEECAARIKYLERHHTAAAKLADDLKATSRALESSARH